MSDVKAVPRTQRGPNPLKPRQTAAARKREKTVWLNWDVKQKAFSTEELNVPGVEVVEQSKGKAFAGPFYLDQIDLLQDTLRGMPKRERYEVSPGETGFWIYRKPTNA